MIFSDQVESLTGITISASSTNPTNDQLTQYLKDGVIDVTAKWLIGHPQDTEDFQIASSEVTSNDSYSPKGTIVSVVRESGTNNDWRSCRKISPSMQSQVVDTESLSFSSKYHPTYMVGDNGKISVFPAASSNPDAFKVYYINNDPKNNTDNAELVHSMSDIRFFPTDKVYLVVLYASIQALHAAMSNNIVSLSITVPTSPVVPSLTTNSTAPTLDAIPIGPPITAVTFTSIDADIDATAPTFITALVSGASIYTVSGTDDPGIFSLAAVPPIVPSDPSFTAIEVDATSIGSTAVIDTIIEDVTVGNMPNIVSTTISSFGTAPSFVPPSLGALDFAQVTTYIETNQDTELAGAKLQELSTEINQFTAKLQSSLNVFNEQNVAYQAEIQQNLQQAQIIAQEASRQVQIDAQKVTDQARMTAQTKQTQAQMSSQTKQSQAQINAQVEQAQAQLDNRIDEQNATIKLQKESQEYSAELQKYSAEINGYQADVNREVQQYTQKLQRYQLLYQSAIQESFKAVDISNGINMAKAQAELQIAISNEDRSMQRQLQNGINDMQAINSDNQSKISKYQSETQSITADNQSKLAKYQADVQAENSDNEHILAKYQSEISDYQAELAGYQAEVAKEIQENTTKVQQYQGLYLQLLQQYNAAFQVAGPQQQGE